MITVKDRVVATLRTVAAGLVGYVLTWAAVRLHVVVSPEDSQLVVGAVFVLLLAAYHAGASAVQRRWPAWTLRFPALRFLHRVVALLLVTDLQPAGYRTPAQALLSQRAAERGRRHSRR